MRIIKKILAWLLQMVVLAAVLLLAFWIKTKYDNKLGQIAPSTQNATVQDIQTKTVPLTNPKIVTFKWSYAGTPYTLSETFYGSLDDFYKNSPKTYQYQGALPSDWEKTYYAMFLQSAANDVSIKKLATDIQQLGAQKNLTADQIVELTLSFVQAIPYDHARAQEISAGTGTPDYPYETLYIDTGVCSDKSLLLAALLKQLGYGAALLVYPSENHMAVGIACPAKYSSYASGYCYAETTATGFRIGMIPDINPTDASAVAIAQLNTFDQSETSQFDAEKLGTAEIFPESSGQEYQGIAQTFALAQEIDSLRAEINTAGKNLVAQMTVITSDEKDLDNLKQKMDKLKSSGNYDDYNKQVPSYNSLVKQIQKEINAYDQQVKTYNQNVAKYNALIKVF